MTAPNFTNRTLWTGDNLDILRGLNSETVDLIYLDPPFNSNQAPTLRSSRERRRPERSVQGHMDAVRPWTSHGWDLIADEQPAIANHPGHAAGRAFMARVCSPI